MEYDVGFVFPGGASKGITQIGQLEVLLEHGIEPDAISGISVGALNGAMLAQGSWEELKQIWDDITKDDIFKDSIGFGTVFGNLFGKRRSLYDNSPLRNLIKENVHGENLKARLLVGAVPLETGQYHCWDSLYPYTQIKISLPDIVLASATLPVLWEPVKQLGMYKDWVDGGTAVQSPLRDMASLKPQKIFIFHCQPKGIQESGPLERIHNVASRAFESLMYHSLRKDISETVRINYIIQHLSQNYPGLEVPRPKGGTYKYLEIYEMYPEYESKPGLMDFNRDTLERLRESGRKSALDLLERMEND